MADLKTIFQNALNTLENKIKDLSTISVTTLTGNVAEVINASNEIDLSAALTKIKGGTLELVAHTEIKLDNDAIIYVKKEFSANDEMIFNLHQNMVNSAIEARKSFIEFVANLLPKLL